MSTTEQNRKSKSSNANKRIIVLEEPMQLSLPTNHQNQKKEKRKIIPKVVHELDQPLLLSIAGSSSTSDSQLYTVQDPTRALESKDKEALLRIPYVKSNSLKKNASAPIPGPSTASSVSQSSVIDHGNSASTKKSNSRPGSQLIYDVKKSCPQKNARVIVLDEPMQLSLPALIPKKISRKATPKIVHELDQPSKISILGFPRAASISQSNLMDIDSDNPVGNQNNRNSNSGKKLKRKQVSQNTHDTQLRQNVKSIRLVAKKVPESQNNVREIAVQPDQQQRIIRPRIIDETLIQQNYIGDMNVLCSSCGAKHFHGEKVKGKTTFDDCCNHGKVTLEPLPEFPDELRSLLENTHDKSSHFLKNIRPYNLTFSFASLNANIVKFDNCRPGPYCFKIQGQVYYQINTALLPELNASPSYGQLFIYDGNEAAEHRSNIFQDLDQNILKMIDQTMRTLNIHAQSYMMMNEAIEIQEKRATEENESIPDLSLLFTVKKGFDPKRYNLQQYNEVAAIFDTTADGEIPDSYVSILNKDTKELKYVSSMNPNTEPWLYPIFYPRGTQCWHEGLLKSNGRKLTRMNFVRYRIAIRDGEFNPFIQGQRLFQQYVVLKAVEIERDRINYCRFNQIKLRRDKYKNVYEALLERAQAQNKRVGRFVILPSSFHGSTRNLQQRYLDAMTVAFVFGRPTLFFTMTCNPQWPEIQKNLLPGQQAHDRPDICSRVFALKVEALVDFIRKQKHFGEVPARVHTIEFQKRGLPHVHLLVMTKGKIDTAALVDLFICAEIPDPILNPRLHRIIMKHMIHGPCDKWCEDENGKCSKHYPKEFQEETTFDSDNSPLYRRRDTGISYTRPNNHVVDNRDVVPYSPILSLMFDCHLNVEVVSSDSAVKYLFKYVLKGYDAASIKISERGNDDPQVLNHDEIDMWLEKRYVGPNEAIWRILSLPMYVSSHAIVRLPVHLPDEQTVTICEEMEGNLENMVVQSSMLMDYFKLNLEDENARQYKYVDIPRYYTHKSEKLDGQKITYWSIRQGHFNTLGRIYPVSPSQVELYHLRLLLMHVRGATSFLDLKTANGVTHETFVEACISLGLVEDDGEWKKAMQEAAFWMMPNQLRSLFVRILIFCNPLYPLQLWEEFKSVLSDDFIRNGNDGILAEKKTLKVIGAMLRIENRNLSDYLKIDGFSQDDDDGEFDPLPSHASVELAEEMYVLLNNEQKNFVDRIMKQIQADKQSAENQNNCYFIEGPGGSGKTFIYKTLYEMLVSRGKNVCMMAFVGVAATLLPSGQTIHRAFGLPVPLLSDSSSHILVQSKQAEYLKKVDVFIWDEAPMAPRYSLEIINRTLQDIMNNNEPFGGKILILGGDFRQLLPVKLQSTRGELVNLSIKNSHLWRYFSYHKLTKNMRALSDEVEFSKFLLKVGDGTLNDNNDNIDLAEFPPQCIASKNADIVEDIYGSVLRNKNFKEVINFAILSARNADVNDLNQRVLDYLDPSTERIYTSINTIKDCDNGAFNEFLTTEYLNSLDPVSLPPHELRLRSNAVVMLIRNLNVKEGLCNGTRLLVIKMSDNALCCEILTGDKAGSIVFLSRITIISENDYSFKFKRRQFPVKLAFAMTINKAQGQTFEKIAIDLRKDVFNHGQLYVALSRVRSWLAVMIYLGEDNEKRKSIKNYVYKELLK